MKIVNLCRRDYANFAYDITMAMKSVGLNVSGYKTLKHNFGYDKQLRILSEEKQKERIEDADIIQIFHSDVKCYRVARIVNPRARFIMYHTGSLYRQNAERINDQVPNIEIVCALGELMTLGCNRPKYIVGAINTDNYKPRLPNKIFGHFPSDEETKGTVKIKRMLLMHNVEFMYSPDKLNHEDHLKRMEKCGVIIELFNKLQSGKPYGSFGITALEAAAMGKIIITQNFTDDVYRKYYGDHPLLLANSAKQFHKYIYYISSLNYGELIDLSEATRKWMEEKHSYKATGNYIMKNIL